ncbi:MAG: hypothetical protein AAF938_23000 [Myxococcota bacterium]
MTRAFSIARLATVLFVVSGALACGDAAVLGRRAELIVEVQTDWIPGSDFTAVAVDAEGFDVERTVATEAERGEYLTGRVVASRDNVPSATVQVGVRLERPDGSTLVEQSREVTIDGRTVVRFAFFNSDAGTPDMGPMGCGDPCDTGNPCEDGVLQCPDNGDPTCVGERRAPGSACITDDVAGSCDNSGSCVAGCIDGSTCERPNACERGVTRCVDGRATCEADGPADAGTVCREAAGECDAEEVCDGATTECPDDVFQPETATCRLGAGPCDAIEQCDGSSPVCPPDERLAAGASCPPDGFCDGLSVECLEGCTPGAPCDTGNRCELGVFDCSGPEPVCVSAGFEPAGTVCRESAGPCDVAEVCDGAGISCPSDGFQNGTVCRDAAGPCDQAELCDGGSAVCPADTKRAESFVCRESAGPCDVADTCDGVADTCPSDQLRPSTSECRASAGACDIVESCDGSSVLCPADVLQPAGVTCRGEAGECDVSELCDGGPLCPDDGFAPTGTSCSLGFCLDGACNDACTPGETCDTGNPCLLGEVDCSTGVPVCMPAGAAPAGTLCRASGGLCDIEEVCDGDSTECPAQTFQPDTTICRPATDSCDADELCTGSSAVCPSDAFLPSTTVCRAAAGVCDREETCSGSGPSCPADAVQPNTVTCRISAGVCDVPEQCTGSDVDCPADGFAGSARVCRSSGGGCDVEERCTGGSRDCGPDVLRPSGFECRADAGECDVREVCTGASAACPANSVEPTGTACSAGFCQNGSCLGGCNPGEACTPATCRVGQISCASGSPVCVETGNEANGAFCDPTTVGPWSGCGGFSGTCDNGGTRTRSVTEQRCSTGTCAPSTSTETGACTRNTNGTMCGGTVCGPFGACGGFSNMCDTTGTRTRTCTDRVCGGGSCNDSTRTDVGSCTRTLTETCGDLIDTDCDGTCDESCRTIPIYRLRWLDGADHLYARQSSASRYVLEGGGPYFHLYSSNVTGNLVQLHRCWIPSTNDHFISTSTACGGFTYEGSLGWASSTERCDAVPLYRGFWPGRDHFYTWSISERDASFQPVGPYIDEGVQAYVWRSP